MKNNTCVHSGSEGQVGDLGLEMSRQDAVLASPVMPTSAAADAEATVETANNGGAAFVITPGIRRPMPGVNNGQICSLSSLIHFIQIAATT